jgi:hypothetical protein
VRDVNTSDIISSSRLDEIRGLSSGEIGTIVGRIREEWGLSPNVGAGIGKGQSWHDAFKKYDDHRKRQRGDGALCFGTH